MKFNPVAPEKLMSENLVGALLVLLPESASGPLRSSNTLKALLTPTLVLVSQAGPHGVAVEPASLLLSDDDSEITERLSASEAAARLRHLVWEVGDRVSFRGRKGTLSQCRANDLHVYLRLDESPDTETYTNIVHLDFFKI